MLSKRILNIGESAPLVINKRVLELKAQGKDIISFGIGEPNFDVPEEARRAVVRAVEENFSRYTASDGIPELKKSIINKLWRDNGLEYGEKNIIASTGAKQSIYQVFQSLLNPGDEVLLPSPYWSSYTEDVKLAGGVIVPVDTAPDFRLTAEMLEPAITPKTKILVLNSPSNPTGMMTEPAELQKIAGLAAAKNFYILSDEVYEYFVYGDIVHASTASFGEEARRRTIVVNGVSKSAGMTGWRLGYAAGPEEIIAGMKKIQDQITSNPSSLSQKGAVAALDLGKSRMADILDDFKIKRDFVCGALWKAGVNVVLPDGAFYVFFNISKFFGGGINNSVDFCRGLLDEAGVALVPGAAFGNDNYARLSYACDIDGLKKGMDRVAIYIDGLKKT
jgi:aspartate aminotransferase